MAWVSPCLRRLLGARGRTRMHQSGGPPSPPPLVRGKHVLASAVRPQRPRLLGGDAPGWRGREAVARRATEKRLLPGAVLASRLPAARSLGLEIHGWSYPLIMRARSGPHKARTRPLVDSALYPTKSNPGPGKSRPSPVPAPGCPGTEGAPPPAPKVAGNLYTLLPGSTPAAVGGLVRPPDGNVRPPGERGRTPLVSVVAGCRPGEVDPRSHRATRLRCGNPQHRPKGQAQEACDRPP